SVGVELLTWNVQSIVSGCAAHSSSVSTLGPRLDAKARPKTHVTIAA
ncbi:MAG: hypothetical protein ACI8TX_002387, partial [Hyphomicrobiaceae bacterium]